MLLIFLSAIIIAFFLYYITILIVKKIQNKEEFSALHIAGSFMFAYIIFCILGLITS
jgi:hypothetical protein